MGRRFADRIQAGSMGSPPQGASCEGCSEKKKKKKQQEEWEKANQDFDSIWGTPFNRVRAITKKHNVAITRLKCYADRNVKYRHDSDTDSSALVADSGPDDSWDGDSDATM